MARNPLAVLAGTIGAAEVRGDHEKADNARRDMRAVRLERAVREAIEAVPPLTDQQRADIVALLLSA